MFYEYKICGSCFWEGEVFYENQLSKNIQKYSNALEKYRSNDRPVALRLSRGIRAVYCMVGLLERGIPFINIDKNIPPQRVEYMLETVGAKYLITDLETLYEGVAVIQAEELDAAVENIPEAGKFSDIAYYMCTSGTTGRPKAVKVLRSGLRNFFEGISDIFPFERQMRIANITSYSFDIVFLELLFSLYNGLSVVLTSEEEVASVKSLMNIIEQNNIDIVQITPSRLRMIQLVDAELKCLDKVKFILIGGEAFPKELLPLLQKKTCRIFNMYGPTETTIWSTVSELTKAEAVNVGRPILNTSIYIVDSDNKICEIGKEGEICIGGEGLSAGYANNEDATKRAFIYLSENGVNERVYKTGDLGMLDSQGILHCYGRLDNQIKLNGNRIELEDIDKNIMNTGLVSGAVTCLDREKNRLVTFYINDSLLDNADLAERLRKTLPETMIPKCYVKVEKFTYTISGKIDVRAMLATVDSEDSTESGSVEDENKSVFWEVMKRYVTGPFDETSRLEDLISDSIIFVQMMVDFEDAYSFEFEAEALVESNYPSVGDLFCYVSELIHQSQN